MMAKIALDRPDLKATEVLAAAVLARAREYSQLNGLLDVHRIATNPSCKDWKQAEKHG